MTTIVKAESIMVGCAVLGFVALALIGRTLQTRGVRDADLQRFTFPLVMGLFLLFGFGLIGLAFHLFIVGQGKIGNGEVSLVASLARHEASVTVGVWVFLSLGFAIAYPHMRRDMLGAPRPAVGPSTGVLRADIDQTLDQVRTASTITVAKTGAANLDGSTRTLGEGVFDFEIPGSGVRFEQCRYYFITTAPGGAAAIDSINIGISADRKPKAESEAEEAVIRKRLTADGWQPGRFVWRTEKDLTLHGGKPTSGEGRYWAKDGTLLILSSRRMDDAKPAEDPATAGEYILFLDLVPRSRASYATLEYGPAPAVTP
jgi:hypothetical protein